MTDCTLCTLPARDAHSLRLYEDDRAVVVLRLREGRPTQLLVVPRHHACSASELGPGLMAHLLKIGARASRSLLAAGRDLGRAVPELLEQSEHVHVRMTAA
jgi:diadenosine tetraphosphate (Ap4A) HIT family hydrolase